MRSLVILASIIGSTIAQKGKSTTDPIYTCPIGYTLDNKTCVKQVIAQPKLLCQDGGLLSDLECLREVHKKTRCPINSYDQGKQCVIKSSDAPVKVCPIGYVDTGVSCETRIGLDIIEYCEEGTREGPDCVTVEITPPNYTQSCPPGYDLADKGGCWKKVLYDCTPSGGKGGLRALAGNSRPAHAKLHIKQQTCERKESAPVISEVACPFGYEAQMDYCLLKNKHPLLKKCVNGLPLDQCYNVKTAPHKQDCANGGRLENNTCVLVRSVPHETYCPEGYDDGNVCIVSKPAVQACPPGLTLIGGVCTGVETAQPEVTVTVTCTGKNCYH